MKRRIAYRPADKSQQTKIYEPGKNTCTLYRDKYAEFFSKYVSKLANKVPRSSSLLDAEDRRRSTFVLWNDTNRNICLLVFPMRRKSNEENKKGKIGAKEFAIVKFSSFRVCPMQFSRAFSLRLVEKLNKNRTITQTRRWSNLETLRSVDVSCDGTFYGTFAIISPDTDSFSPNLRESSWIEQRSHLINGNFTPVVFFRRFIPRKKRSHIFHGGWGKTAWKNSGRMFAAEFIAHTLRRTG